MTIQYRTIVEGAVWVDVSARGRVRFEGRDAASFLHALVTNDVAGLPAGQGTYAAWLTPQGRMITDLRLLRDESSVWAEVPEGLASGLLERFDHLIFAEDVRVSDHTSGTASFLAVGHGAAAAVADRTGADVAQVASLPLWGHFRHADTRIIRVDDTDSPTFEVWSKKASGGFFSLSNEKKPPDAFFDTLRIEAGRPKFGVDMNTDTIPLEAGLLDRAISQTKGCYVGQEVIVRILHRGGGRIVRHLMRLQAEGDERDVPSPGTPLRHEERQVGAITSAAFSPRLGAIVALGYVHRDVAVPGSTLHTPHGATFTITAFAS